MSYESDIAVRVRGLSKAYTIAHHAERHVTLAESLLARARRPFARAPKETFWALRDVDFNIEKGDVVGIIGRNGAGKSTLLKILSRITEPTAGQIDLFGRVGSLLEVGTGFHPELTGRENVFLNGAILGMSKAEIRHQFDAIVNFAGVEKFLDTPVKRYSSGMYVRLAFAVAAYLNPEILIVDEVLAVGDAEFQSRCLGKMRDVASAGRTVIFVSHHLPAVQALCNRIILLRDGQIHCDGDVQTGIEEYRTQGLQRSDGGTIRLDARMNRTGSGPIRLEWCKLLHKKDARQKLGSRYLPGEPIGLRLGIHSPHLTAAVAIGYALLDANGTVLFTSHHNDAITTSGTISAGKTVLETWINPNPLLPGNYIIQAGILVGGRTSDFVPEMVQIEVERITTDGGPPIDQRPGAMYFRYDWNVLDAENVSSTPTDNS